MRKIDVLKIVANLFDFKIITDEKGNEYVYYNPDDFNSEKTKVLMFRK